MLLVIPKHAIVVLTRIFVDIFTAFRRIRESSSRQSAPLDNEPVTSVDDRLNRRKRQAFQRYEVEGEKASGSVPRRIGSATNSGRSTASSHRQKT